MSRPPTVWELFDLKGKVFFVAGGARNLGRNMATALAEAHADGVVTSRDLSAAETTAEELSATTGQTVVGQRLDATDETSVREAVAAAVERFGRIDILVNNVGGGGGGAPGRSDLEERELDAWLRIQETNVTAPWLVTKHVAPVMREQQSGAIVNIASIAGMIGRDRSVYVEDMTPQPIDYAAAKAGVIGMTRDMAAYLSQYGIRVNSISPGGFERGQPRGFIERYSAKTMLGRMGRDGVDLKGAVVYLASEAAAYVTGHNLVVDGGFTAWQ